MFLTKLKTIAIAMAVLVLLGIGALTSSILVFGQTSDKADGPGQGEKGLDGDALVADMKFVKVPKGKFWMGWQSGKQTSKQVEIKQNFELAAYIVTQGQWEGVIGAGSNPSGFSRQGELKDRVKDVSDADLKRFPVDQVSWDDVQVFLKKLNERQKGKGWTYRLPKEAEWEYACRGAATSKEECSFDFYLAKPTNDLSSKDANFNGDNPAGKGAEGINLTRPTKVGSYAPNKLGLYDMHGNVWQWCEDLYDAARSERVIRGGGYSSQGLDCGAGVRNLVAPSHGGGSIGFRLVRVSSGKPPADKQTPGEKPALHAEPLFLLLGKDHLSEEIQEFRQRFKEEPTTKYHTLIEKCFYHSWKAHGVSLSFGQENKLKSIFLYAGDSEEFQPYKGELPASLSFADNADAVEKKLGRQAEMLGGGEGGVRCWCDYSAKGMHVVFKTFDPKDRKATVAWIVLFQPDRAPAVQDNVKPGARKDAKEDKSSVIFGVVKEVDEKSILLSNVSSQRDRSTSKKPAAPDVRVLLNEKTEFLRETGFDAAPAKLADVTKGKFVYVNAEKQGEGFVAKVVVVLELMQDLDVQPPVPKAEANDLIQGTWDVTMIEVDGEVRNAEKEERWTIGKDKIQWTNRIRPVELTYSLVPTQTPKMIDMEISAGVGTGGMFKGIYSLEGDTLKVCYQIGGEKRPQAFQTAKGNSTRVLLVLSRKKPAKDAKADQTRFLFGVVKEVDEKSILLTGVSSERDRSKKPAAPDVRVLLNEKTKYLRETGDDAAPAKLADVTKGKFVYVNTERQGEGLVATVVVLEWIQPPEPKAGEKAKKGTNDDKTRVIEGVVKEVDEKSILLVTGERVLLNEKTEYLQETPLDAVSVKRADVTKGKLVSIQAKQHGESLVAIEMVLRLVQPGRPQKLARIPDPSPELRKELYAFDSYRHGSEEKFVALERKADELLKRYTGRDDQARICFEVAHVAGQSDIRNHVKRVRKYAGKSLARSRDPLQRSRLYSYLGSAAEVEAENTFDDRRRQAATELLAGYAEMLAQKLPEKALELPAVDKLRGEGIEPTPSEAAIARHAAQMAARQEAEFIRELVDRRDTLANQLRWLYHPDSKIHGRNSDGPEELRALAGKVLNEPKAVKVLLARVTAP